MIYSDLSKIIVSHKKRPSPIVLIPFQVKIMKAMCANLGKNLVHDGNASLTLFCEDTKGGKHS